MRTHAFDAFEGIQVFGGQPCDEFERGIVADAIRRELPIPRELRPQMAELVEPRRGFWIQHDGLRILVTIDNAIALPGRDDDFARDQID